MRFALLVCPFCGGTPKFEQESRGTDWCPDTLRIVCILCEVAQPARDYEEDTEIKVANLLAEQWNRRHHTLEEGWRVVVPLHEPPPPKREERKQLTQAEKRERVLKRGAAIRAKRMEEKP